MKHKLFALLLSVLPVTIASAQINNHTKRVQFDTVKLLEHVKVLSSDQFEGRGTGTIGNEKARLYIIDQFKTLNVEPFEGEYQQVFNYKRGKKTKTGTNVLGYIKGEKYPEKYIVISAHHDHLGIRDGEIYNGADDDASGISALFSFAEVLKKNRPKHSIILAAFDVEEFGGDGSTFFVQGMRNQTIVANLNMDMISRSLKNELYVVGTRYNKKFKTIISNFKNPTTSKLLIGHDGTDGKHDWTYASDHGSFHKAGIPFLYFGNEDHSAYHKPTDDFLDITPEFYKNAVQIIMSIFTTIDTEGL